GCRSEQRGWRCPDRPLPGRQRRSLHRVAAGDMAGARPPADADRGLLSRQRLDHPARRLVLLPQGSGCAGAHPGRAGRSERCGAARHAHAREHGARTRPVRTNAAAGAPEARCGGARRSDRIAPGGRLRFGLVTPVVTHHPDHGAEGEEHAGPPELARIEDALRALRAAFGRREPAYAGTHYRFEGFLVDPCGAQAQVPIWLGGRSPRSLRRALVFGDGWDPFRLTLDELGALLTRARASREWRARTA